MARFGLSALTSLLKGIGAPATGSSSWSRPFGLGWEQPYTVRYASNLDDGPTGTVRELVDDEMLGTTQDAVLVAGNQIRANSLCRLSTCDGCDFAGICRPAAGAAEHA